MRSARFPIWLFVTIFSGAGCHKVSEIDRPVLCNGVYVSGTVPSSCPTSYMSQNGACVPVPPSCTELAAACGPTCSDNCCQYDTIDDLKPDHGSITYSRGWDATNDPVVGNDTLVGMGWQDQAAASATVGSFTLDRYEVTIGRFRSFLAGYGTLLHDGITPGEGGYPAESPILGSGWQWNTDDGELGTGHPIPLYAEPDGGVGAADADVQALRDLIATCSPTDPNGPSLPTNPSNAILLEWLDDPMRANDQKPMTCVSWYEAFMFCLSDRARLPTEAEWQAAASAGSQQRAFAWSSPADDTTITGTAQANIGGSGGVDNVGQFAERTSYFGPFDLTGNVTEFVYDSVLDITQYVSTVASFADGGATTDAGIATPDPLALDVGGNRIVRGGSYKSAALSARVVYRHAIRNDVGGRYEDAGWRCARPAYFSGAP
jgi:formylglycine-generating enzyme required for sulfatase activity